MPLPCVFPSPPIGSFFIILPSLSPPFPKEWPEKPALAHCFCFHGTPLRLNSPLWSCPRVPGALYCPLVAKFRWHSRVPPLSWFPEVGDIPNSMWLSSLVPLGFPSEPCSLYLPLNSCLLVPGSALLFPISSSWAAQDLGSDSYGLDFRLIPLTPFLLEAPHRHSRSRLQHPFLFILLSCYLVTLCPL